MTDQPQWQAETKVLSIGNRYRPLYRLRPGDQWCFIRKDKKPVECETASQALRMADDLVEAIVSPSHLIEEEAEPLGNIDDWRAKRAADLEAERQKVFGARHPSTIFLGGGRTVQVVEKGKRRASR